MNCTGTGCTHTSSYASGMLRPATGHEGGGLFVPDPNVGDALASLSHCFDDRIDSVSDDPEHMAHTPRDQGVDQQICRCRIAADLGSEFAGDRNGRFSGDGATG